DWLISTDREKSDQLKLWLTSRYETLVGRNHDGTLRTLHLEAGGPLAETLLPSLGNSRRRYGDSYSLGFKAGKRMPRFLAKIGASRAKVLPGQDVVYGWRAIGGSGPASVHSDRETIAGVIPFVWP